MPRTGIVSVFARHRVACNLLMLGMILVGLWSLTRLNTQFFPSFALDFINVTVRWTGASAEDVVDGIVIPLEQVLDTTDGLKELTSSASEGSGVLMLEFEEGTDISEALDRVKESVALVRNLPREAEEPEISRLIRYEPVARLLVTTTGRSEDLRPLVRQFERELLARKIARINIVGLPKEEISIQVPSNVLHQLGFSLDDIATRIRDVSRDLPAGTVGRQAVAQQLRATEQSRRETDFERLAFRGMTDGELVRLGDIATIERRPRAAQAKVRNGDNNAVMMKLLRSESADSLESAEIIQTWLAETRPNLPPGVGIEVFDENWELLAGRIALLLKNGLGGLVLVVGTLFLFLNGRVAFWVAVGIPVSFLAALGVLLAIGGSINMVSLFALIMTLGIIVDDAIVVGEEALAQYERGAMPADAAENGAMRMLAPVMSSSLTTIAAFFPLLLVGGTIGNILFDIPLIVLCVITASVIESFFVLPGHLNHAFTKMAQQPISKRRRRFEDAFERFRDGRFRRAVSWSIDHPGIVFSAAIASFIVAIGLVVGGRVPFQFFPSTEGTILYAQVNFAAGTPIARVESFLTETEEALVRAVEPLDSDIVKLTVSLAGQSEATGNRQSSGDQLGTILVELSEPDARDVRNPELIEAWRKEITLPPGIESFSIQERRAGPPGRDIDIRLLGQVPETLKIATEEVAQALRSTAGVITVVDDLPYGQQQLLFDLNSEGQSLGLSVASVGAQVRAAFDGAVAQIYQDGEEELEVRVVLPERERNNMRSLEGFPVALPGGGTVPLMSIIDLDHRRGFDKLRRKDGRLASLVSVDIDTSVANANEMIETLNASVLPEIKKRYGIEYRFEGRRADQAETFGDMGQGAMLGLILIYIVLAWVFASYGWPLVVMAAIPFGIVGAIGGHWLLGIDLTILSLFGIFGLVGIVVNDSIILIVFYRQLREEGGAVKDAVTDAACQRLRAVALTSLTTIGGLTPLMFETSLQAQFLIPMAASISFGLGVATVLILLVIPTLLAQYEQMFYRPGLPKPDAPAPAAAAEQRPAVSPEGADTADR